MIFNITEEDRQQLIDKITFLENEEEMEWMNENRINHLLGQIDAYNYILTNSKIIEDFGFNMYYLS